MKPLNLFIIQPFGAKHSQHFWNLINKVCASFPHEFEVIRADKKPSDAGSRLQDRIDSYIKKADICLADLTGSRNENVLLEVGAAFSLDIPIVIIADKTLPSDISNNLFIHANISDFDKEECTAAFCLELKQRLSEILYTARKLRKRQFIVHGYQNRRIIDFYSLVKRSQNRIHILTTNLGFVVNEDLVCGVSHIDKDTSEIPRHDKMTLLEMIALELPKKLPSFSIRILTLDPDSNYTNERASALSRHRQQFREHMRDDLRTVIEFVRSDDCKASVEVKTYDAFPLQMTYFFDDLVVSSVVNNSQSSRECVTYLHSLEELGVKNTYEHHFNNLWAGGNSVARGSKHAPRKNTWKRECSQGVGVDCGSSTQHPGAEFLAR